MDPHAQRADVPGLEQLVPKQVRRPGARYVRIVAPRREFRRAEGHYVATEAAMVPPGYTGRIFAGVRRALFGPPLATEAFFFSSRRRHTRFDCDWSSDVCSSD